MKSLNQFFILITAFLCLNSCDRGRTTEQGAAGNGDPEYIEISIRCDSCFQKVLTAWIEDFNRSHPMIALIIADSNADFSLISEDHLIELKDTGLWNVPVMREGIIPLISARNPYLEKLQQQGISKENLVRIFTGDQISWGEVLGTDAGEQFAVYLPERGKGFNTKWANFLDINVESLQGERYAYKDSLLNAFTSNPYAIAVLNACCAFDPETNEIRGEVAPLSIDLNNDGRIDKKEHISNDLCEVERDLYLGLHPSELCHCIFLLADEMPATEEKLVFIKWILTKGQHHVADHGYSVIRHTAAKKIIEALEARDQ
ncbi:MAG: hypothetical protein V2I47_07295 [Bacteroidales bacterium]|jgi:phosphate transport system substrate-binding protein|nr:hypothetical protein [Bacteroidales bacterium]